MSDATNSPAVNKTAVQDLVFAGLCEAACILAGVIAFFLTGKLIWIATGIVASLGFSLPAVIRFVRVMRERDRASR